MLKVFILSLSLLGISFLFFSCDKFSQKNKLIEKSKDHEIVSLSDSSYLIKKFYADGSLKKETMVNTDKKKHGNETYYYQNGKACKRFNYENGVKQGKSYWYYKSGKPYCEKLYKDGLLHGISKKYYENGTLMAEMPYLNDEPQKGLKEYSRVGKLLSTPSLQFKEIDKLELENKVDIQIKLSKNKIKKVDYYSLTIINNDTLISNIKQKDGMGIVSYYISPGNTRIEKLWVRAIYKTYKQNKGVVEGVYNFARENAQFKY